MRSAVVQGRSSPLPLLSHGHMTLTSCINKACLPASHGLGEAFKMAQAGVFLEHDQFNCSICLDVLKDPVTIPCGHSYCKGCIKGYWDQDDYLGIYGCPQCRQTFTPRPVLGRNTMLADVVEKLKMTGLNAAPSDPTHAEPGDVECDVCSGKKNKAFKSCLVCLVSYCESHIQAHFESPAFQKHRLVSPSRNIREQLCRQHEKLLEVFCRTDQQCICHLCLTDEHKGHDTVLASKEMNEKKVKPCVSLACCVSRNRSCVRKLKRMCLFFDKVSWFSQKALAEMQRISQQRIQEREQELADLRQATQMLTVSLMCFVMCFSSTNFVL